ncbi:chitin deacetylase [Kappamyces sp. JEL0829]|nr:chitin deacetylase [Kappamyces sp. JEL0829]
MDVFLLAAAVTGLSGTIQQPSFLDFAAAQHYSKSVVIGPASKPELLYNFSAFPPPFQLAPGNPSLTALFNLSLVPTAAPSQPLQSKGPVNCVTQVAACSWACHQCLRPSDIQSCPSHQDWGFTFDDALLDWLKVKEVKATFCLVGSQVIKYPDLVKRQYEEGHHIVIHTWSHYALTSLSTEVVIAELEWTARAIQTIIGVRPKYFRPPYGDVDDRVRSIAAAMGLVPIIWNYDTSDWALASALSPVAKPRTSSSSSAEPSETTTTTTSKTTTTTATTTTTTTTTTEITTTSTATTTVDTTTTTVLTTQESTTVPPTTTQTTTVTTVSTAITTSQTTTSTSTSSSQPSSLPTDIAAAMIQKVSSQASQWRSASSGILCLEHDIYQATAQLGPLVGQAVLNAGMRLASVAQCVGDSRPYVETVATVSLNTATTVSATIPPTADPSHVSTSGDVAKRLGWAGLLIALFAN